MSSSPGAKFTAGGFKAINDSLDSIRKKAEAATQAIKGIFDVQAGSFEFIKNMADYTEALADLNKQAQATVSSLKQIHSSASVAAKSLGKVGAGMKRTGMRMGPNGPTFGGRGGGGAPVR